MTPEEIRQEAEKYRVVAPVSLLIDFGHGVGPITHEVGRIIVDGSKVAISRPAPDQPSALTVDADVAQQSRRFNLALADMLRLAADEIERNARG